LSSKFARRNKSLIIAALMAFLPNVLRDIREDDRAIPETYIPILSKARNLPFTNLDIYPLASITKNKLLIDLNSSIFPGQNLL